MRHKEFMDNLEVGISCYDTKIVGAVRSVMDKEARLR